MNDRPDNHIGGNGAAVAEMSELGSLASIFFEPGRVFESFVRKPRFIAGLILIVLLATAYSFAINYKVGEEAIRSFTLQQMENNPSIAAMSKEEKENALNTSMKFQTAIRYALPIIIIAVMLLGGLLYWLGTKAFGGSGGFLHSLSVWVYSSIPPAVISTLGSFLVMAFKPATDIDLAAAQRGLLQANLGMFLGPGTNPILATLLSVLDLFSIWGWILAAIGLRVTNRLSSGSAWTIVAIVAAIGVLFRLIGAVMSGTAS